MLKRIKYLQKTRGITNEMLAEKSGVSVWSVQKQTAGIYKLNINIVIALLALCPDVSADWLLLGRGEMTNTNTNDITKRIEDLEQKISSLNP